jgi:D-threo-aldose 1-dehydrogenase
VSEEARALGGSSLPLPAIGLGCAPLGGLREPLSEAAAEATLASAWDAGIRLFDTSPWYGRGLSELRLGRFLRQQPRKSFLVSTKVGRTFHRPRDAANYRSEFWAGGLPFEHRLDYTYDGIMRSYEHSLVRLGLNTVDLLLIHDLDIAEVGSADLVQHHFHDLDRSGWRALETLRREGEIMAVGAGVNIRGTIAAMLQRWPLDFFLVAMPYTLLDQQIMNDEFPLCQQRGARILIGSPFASGILATGTSVPRPFYNYVPATSDVIARTRQIEAVCARHGVSLKAAAVQFPLLNPLVSSVLVGAVNAEQASENSRLLRPSIPVAFWLELSREGLIEPGAVAALAP